MERIMNGEWWVIKEDSAYTALIAQGYREHTQQRRHGIMWCFMLPPANERS